MTETLAYGTHLSVFSQSFLMNTNMTWFRQFSDSLPTCPLDETFLQFEKSKITLTTFHPNCAMGSFKDFRASPVSSKSYSHYNLLLFSWIMSFLTVWIFCGINYQHQNNCFRSFILSVAINIMNVSNEFQKNGRVYFLITILTTSILYIFCYGSLKIDNNWFGRFFANLDVYVFT